MDNGLRDVATVINNESGVNITFNRQSVTQRCAECAVEFTEVRGQIFDDDVPFGLYLIALHGHSPDGLLAHLAIAVLDPLDQVPHPIAVAMRAISFPDQFGYVAVDWCESPFCNDSYLGERLDREKALASPHRDTFFHIAGHIVSDLPEAQHYFTGEFSK